MPAVQLNYQRNSLIVAGTGAWCFVRSGLCFFLSLNWSQASRSYANRSPASRSPAYRSPALTYQSLQTSAFICCDGHVKGAVMIKNFSSQSLPTEQNAGSFVGGTSEKAQFAKENFSNCLFLICPRSSNLVKQSLMHDLGLGDGVMGADLTNEGNQQEGEMGGGNDEAAGHNNKKHMLDIQKIQDYKSKLLNEFKYNYDTLEKSKTASLCYNQGFQLLHLASAKWLACYPIEAKYEKENFKMTLDDYSSDATVFKIMHAFKFQKDGDQVVFAGEIVQIVRAISFHNKTTYLHSSTEIQDLKGSGGGAGAIGAADKQKSTQFNRQSTVGLQRFSSKLQQPNQQQQVKHNQPIMKREVNASIGEATSWKINFYATFTSENEKFLRCGDVIWMHHSEVGAIISSSRKGKGVDKYNFSSLNLQHWLSRDNLDLVVEKQKATDKNFEIYQGNSFGMWIIENKDQQCGGLVQFQPEKQDDEEEEEDEKNLFLYRLKHISSGCYLSVQKIDASGNLIPYNPKKKKNLVETEEKHLMVPPLPQKKVSISGTLGGGGGDNNINKLKSNGSTSLPPIQSKKSSNKILLTEKSPKQQEEEDNPIKIVDEQQVTEEQQDGEEIKITQEDQISQDIGQGESQAGLIKDFQEQADQPLLKTEDQEQQLTENKTLESKRTDLTLKEKQIYIQQENEKIKQKLLLKEQQEKGAQYVLRLSHKPDDTTLFQFFQLKTEAKSSEEDGLYLQSGRFLYIKNQAYDRYIDIVSALDTLSQASSKSGASAASTSSKGGGKNNLLLNSLQIQLMKKRVERQLFRMYAATKSEVFEVNFVISCFKRLAKFILTLNRCKITSKQDEQMLTTMKEKISLASKIVASLDDFVRNKHCNSNLDQKYGCVNSQRQKLLLEQYYMEILVKILEDALPRQHMEFWTRRKKILEQERIKKWQQEQIAKGMNPNLLLSDQKPEDEEEEEEEKQEEEKDDKSQNQSRAQNQEATSILKMKTKKTDGVIDSKEFFEFIDSKVRLCKQIYQLITGICKYNSPNGLYAFDLIPFFQIHCKYIPEAVDCLIKICQNNELILSRLTENLRIDFNYQEQQAVQVDQGRVIKFLINLYDGESYDNPKWAQEQHIEFRQHEKLTAKPINLINYFMNLIWDKTSENRPSYLRFLSTICRVEDRGISLNQENIFKLYKKYNAVRKEIQFDRYFKNRELVVPPNASRELIWTVGEELHFYAELAYGRNYLWRKELLDYFSDQYLVKNIWIEEGPLGNLQDIRSYFCNLITSLYIDYDPLHREFKPTYCRLFARTEQPEDLIKLDTKQKDLLDILLKGLVAFLGRFTGILNEELNKFIPVIKDKSGSGSGGKLGQPSEEEIKQGGKKLDRGKNFLNNKLLLNTAELLLKLLKLNVFDIMEFRDQYCMIILNVIKILIYEKHNPRFVACFMKTDNDVTKDRLEKKHQLLAVNLNINMFSSLAMVGNLMGMGKKGDDEEDMNDEGNDKQFEVNSIDDPQIFNNPIMRGFISLNNKLESLDFEDSFKKQNEIDIKLHICEVIDHLLDLRQDYLMHNVLGWFNQHIVEGENKEKDKENNFVDGILKDHIKGILPNVAKTGITDIDEQYKPKEEQAVGFPALNLMNMLNKKKVIRFTRYIKNQAIKEVRDIDTYFSIGIDEREKDMNKDDGDPKGAVFPSLMCGFLLIQDEQLEKKCLRVMMRLFNQRLELKQNLSKMQIIFDKEKTKLYTFLRNNYNKLKRLIEQSEVWMQTMRQPQQQLQQSQLMQSHLPPLQSQLLQSQQMPQQEECECLVITKIIRSLRNGLLMEQKYNEDCTEISQTKECSEENINKVDPDKQTIQKYLKAYDPVLTLLRDTMTQFCNFMLDDAFPLSSKKLLHNLYQTAYDYLLNFVKDNSENQAFMHKFLDIFMMHIRFDVGQIQLVSEIFKDNFELLQHRIDASLIEKFVLFIEREGRQENPLLFFDTIQRCKGKYLFENQLMVMNCFLPLKDLEEKHIKLLYADGTKNNYLTLYFEDTASLERLNMIQKLQEVNFRDTYRDEPFLYHSKLFDVLLKTTFTSVKDTQELQDFLDCTKINFNISMNKLKKIFRSQYLMTLLFQPDDFIPSEAMLKSQQSQMQQQQQQQQQQQSPQKQSGLLQVQESVSRGKKVSSTMILGQMGDEQEVPQFQAYENMDDFKKAGFSLLKPHVLNFYRCLHIMSDKQMSHGGPMTLDQQDFALFVEREAKRLEKDIMPNSHFKIEYAHYLFNELLSTFITYYEKYFLTLSDDIDEEIFERRDIKQLELFADILSLKINIFNEKLNRRQIMRAELFLQQHEKLIGELTIQPKIEGLDRFESAWLSKKDESQFSTSILGLKRDMSKKMSQAFSRKKSFKKSDQLQPQPVRFDNEERKSQQNEDQELLADIKNQQLIVIPEQPLAQPDEEEQQPQLAANNDNLIIQKEPSAIEMSAIVQQGGVAPEQEKQGGGMFKKMGMSFMAINLMKPALKPEEMFDPKNMVDVENSWNFFINLLQTTKSVEQEIDIEKQILAEAIMNVNKFVKEDYMKEIEPRPEIDLVLKKFIVFLQFGVSDLENKLTLITLLQVLQKIVLMTDDQNRPAMQNKFDKLGATRMILFVISENHPNLDGSLLINFLLFINALLEGGNTRIQKTIYDFFSGNQKSEVIFQKFNYFIRKQIDSIESKSKDKKQGAKKQQQQNSEDEPMEVEVLEQEDEATRMLDVEILECVLNFLKLCVTGHNLDLQNYLRYQKNSRNSYDMVNAVADILRTYYFECRTQQMYGNMIKCLNTLSEFVSGPCLENQVAVSEGKFFDIVNDLFAIKKKVKESSSNPGTTMKTAPTSKQTQSAAGSQTAISSKRQSVAQPGMSKAKTGGSTVVDNSLLPWMIARLQNKCLILVLSLLEMRDPKEGNSIIKRIIRNLPLNMLQWHMIKVHKKFTKIYKLEYRIDGLDHLKKDPREVQDKGKQQKQQDLYFETIIQNGFYIFFLICYYMDSGERIEGEIIQLFKQQQKFVEQKSGLEDLLLGDNIIGQILKFALTLVKQSLELAQEMKEQTIGKMLKLAAEKDPNAKQRLQREKLARKKKQLKKTFTFFFDNTAHIDVVRFSKLETVYFILLPSSQCLPKEKKLEFHEGVDRSSVKSKVQGLVEASEGLIEICKHEERLRNYFAKNKFLAIFANYVKLWKDLAFIFTIILNIFILMSYSTLYGSRMYHQRLFMKGDMTEEDTQQYFQIFGILMTCCSSFVVAFFLFKNAPLIIQKALYENKKDKQKEPPNFIKRIIDLFIKFFKLLIQFAQEIEVIFYLSYGALAVLGTVVHPFFFVFHLSEILIRYPTLKSVIKAVYEPRDQLGLTYVLFLIVVYVFTVLAYNFFYLDYDGMCQRVVYCFTFNMDFTFKVNAGVGGYLSELETDGEGNLIQEYKVGRIFYDNLYNIFVAIILVNIVSGIIIDTFGSLREKENDKNQDIKDKCFICGNLKVTFERKADPKAGFTQHIKNNHYMWNYMHYVAYLKWKTENKDELTGIESYVMDKLDKDDYTWFPFNKARELDNLDEEDEEKEQKAIDQLKSTLNDISNQAEQAKKDISIFSKSKSKKSSGD